MRYRAVLRDKGNTTPERPTQIMGNNRDEIDRWALQVLKTAQEGAVVDVYETFESRIAVLPRPKA